MASRSVQQMPMEINNFSETGAMVSSGKDHTLVLTTNGLVYGFGSNVEG
eukprot:CAMPEP_0170508494 /NCGR_PEP_ID=MMETSP0208-20121228/62513_1 /TAXON_ID=197538 /ORGANISM="Strombidium inclinatum, Strain S3" /LENGTH=48 /DNA_ID= /DNA_START= /DNA_END= /DNA_ORIENTATION=